MSNSIALIGAGWYGAHLALSLAKEGYEVTLLEQKNQILNSISGNFGARLHLGPHYPRSKMTRIACQKHFNLFKQTYPDLIYSAESVYAVGMNDYEGNISKVDVETFRAVCAELDYYEELDSKECGYENVKAAFKIEESGLLLGSKLRKKMQQYLDDAKVNVVCNCQVNSIERTNNRSIVRNNQSSVVSDFVINTTSFQSLLPQKESLPFGIEIVYQPLIALLYQDKDSHLYAKPLSFTVMDGWYPAISPYDNSEQECAEDLRKYIVTHAKIGIIASYSNVAEAYDVLLRLDNHDKESIGHNIANEVAKFWPKFAERFTYHSRLETVIAKIKTERDFRNSLTFQDAKNDVIYVVPGKINSIFDAERDVKSFLDNKNIYESEEGYRYVEDSMLLDSRAEVTEKPIDTKRSTYLLQNY